MELKSLSDLAMHLGGLHVEHARKLQHGLERCAKRIEATAKAEIGKYQPAVGPFPDWPALADSTEYDKARHGFPVDAPLLRTGEMRDSIRHEVSGLEAVIGATDPTIVYHEFGTSRIPPRPVMGPAAFRNKEFILKTIGEASVEGLTGGERIHPSLGYGGE